eukprot:4349007-Amphidinium_carterae.3
MMHLIPLARHTQHFVIHRPGLKTLHELPFVRLNQSLPGAKVVNRHKSSKCSACFQRLHAIFVV